MTVKEFSKAMGLRVFNEGDSGRQIAGGYAGDLLSWVMGRAGQGSAWITIMQNQNVAAVAVLSDVSCVILAEGTLPDEELAQKAEAQGICLLGSQLSSYELCYRLRDALAGREELFF